PAEARDFVGTGDLKVFYPIPKSDSHKGDNGVVLVVGGGPYTGAPALAGMAAYRTGADIVYLAVPERIWQVVAGYSSNFIVNSLSGDAIRPEHVSEIVALSKKCTAVVLGNGAGSDELTIKALAECIKKINKPMVVDAEGITALSKMKKSEFAGKTIVATPHAGEFERLTGEKLPADTAARAKIVKKWAEKLGIVLLVKGPVDVISDGKRIKLNKVHNAGMTVGGTGDVLAGITGELLAKCVEPFYAGALAAYLNGSAGNLAFAEKSYSLLATDIIEKLPEALMKN
ncbi:MAG: NAD(P)H-hydrate dehydratase, partial [Candidatus Thermoplasmatota archaeon]|nr:NAD(P)H-hydrate dehydratase [Candidatus Thermoplasmatota archaeon]